MSERKRQYIRSDEAWYAAANGITRPAFSLALVGDGCAAEFTIAVDEVGPVFEGYSDGWLAVASFQDAMQYLADQAGVAGDFDADAFEEWLKANDVEDVTPRTPPGPEGSITRPCLLNALLEWRGIEPGDACEGCGGAGRRSYPNAARGQEVGICETCWGSGSKSRPGVNLETLTTLLVRVAHQHPEIVQELADASRGAKP